MWTTLSRMKSVVFVNAFLSQLHTIFCHCKLTPKVLLNPIWVLKVMGSLLKALRVVILARFFYCSWKKRGILCSKNLISITLFFTEIQHIFVFDLNWGKLDKALDK